MLEQLFGSKTRTKLLKLFMVNPERSYFIRELTRLTDTQINSVRRELQNLMDCKIIKILRKEKELDAHGQSRFSKKGDDSERQPKKYFIADTHFVLFQELRSLFVKSPLLYQESLLEELKQLEGIDLAVVTGFFVDEPRSPVDLLLVGSPQRQKLAKALAKFEKLLEREINYSSMSTDEFIYRKSLTDRFLFKILEGKKIIVIDRLPLQS